VIAAQDGLRSGRKRRSQNRVPIAGVVVDAGDTMAAPLISVLMPAWNRQKYIATAMSSVLQQTHRNLELLVYDDGSTDLTADVVQSYCALDPRIRLIVGDKNRGVAYARNVLLDEAKSDLCAWMDSDDISNFYRLEIQVKQMAGHSGVRRINARFQYLHKCGKRRPWREPPGGQSASEKPRCAFASSMFIRDKAVRFDPRITLGAEDCDWMKAMCEKYGAPWNSVLILYYYRKHKNAITQMKKLRKNRREKRRQLGILEARWGKNW